MEANPRRPAHLHAGNVSARRVRPESREEWRRHLHHEPPGLLRRLHLVPRREANSAAVADDARRSAGGTAAED